MTRYVVTELAGGDISEIVSGISEDDPGAARRLGLRLVRTFELLAESPRMGREFHPRQGLRRINEGVYAILYRVRETDVQILRVVHGMRDLDALYGE